MLLQPLEDTWGSHAGRWSKLANLVTSVAPGREQGHVWEGRPLREHVAGKKLLLRGFHQGRCTCRYAGVLRPSTCRGMLEDFYGSDG